MKINFPSLFQTSLHKYRFFFIYGNDLIVFERVLSYLQKKFSLPLHPLAQEDLLNKVSSQLSLFEESTQPSLTFLSSVTDKILDNVEKLTEGFYIFTSEKARAQSKLVTYFAQSSHSLAIAAYASPLTSSEFEFLVEDMNLPVSFKSLLFKAYQNDYMGLLTTLQKIKLYGEVPEAHYDSFLSPFTSTDEFSQLIQAVLLKNKEKAVFHFSSLGGSDLILFLRSLIRSFQTLFEATSFKRSSPTTPWQTLTFPVFFKDQPLYESALSKWNLSEIHTFIETLLTLERRIKFSSFTSSQAYHELLLLLSK